MPVIIRLVNVINVLYNTYILFTGLFMKKLLIVVAIALVGWWLYANNTTEESADPTPSDAMEQDDVVKSEVSIDDAMQEDAMKVTDGNLEEDEAMKQNSAMMDDGSFTLSAKTAGDSGVLFTWSVPEVLAEGAEGFRFARGEEANPTYPSSWWWERGPAHRELTWEGLPEGDAHFRACIVRNGECAEYSNDVMVTVE